MALEIMPKECERKKQVLAVGRYVYQKGFDLLIPAWAKVVEKHPDWILKIYGDGDRSQYNKIVKDFNLEKKCLLKSATPNIIDKYYESSIFVLSSRYEGFVLVLVCGCFKNVDLLNISFHKKWC